MGNFEEAQSLLEKSLTIYRQHFSEDHNEIIWALERLEYTHNKVSNYKKDQTGDSKV
ncbi:tetratricopeptide repeat protein [Kamptonema cortianum]|nr:tetratricopeptide repeat protein [Kamptonema cortianum]